MSHTISSFTSSVLSAQSSLYASTPEHLRGRITLRPGYFGGNLYIQLKDWKEGVTEFSLGGVTLQQAKEAAWVLGSELAY